MEHTCIPLLGIYPKNLKSEYYRDSATSIFVAAQFTITMNNKLWTVTMNNKLWNQPGVPSTDEWIKKMYKYRMD